MEDLLCYATFAEIALDNSLIVGLAYHVIDRVHSMHHSVTTSGASAQDSLPPHSLQCFTSHLTSQRDILMHFRQSEFHTWL